MFSSKTEPENTWVRVMGTSCADGSAGFLPPGGGLSTSSAGGRRPARGAPADRLGDGVAQAGRTERPLQRLLGAELHGDPPPVKKVLAPPSPHRHTVDVRPPPPPPARGL